MQRLLQVALVGTAKDILDWQQRFGRVATGNSQNWLLTFKRVGSAKPKDILANLIGVSYINYALFGRGPDRRPPVSNIMNWLRARGIKSLTLSLRDMAYVIAKNIGDNGTKSVKLQQQVLDFFYSSNIQTAIDKVLPDINEETENFLVNDFVDKTKGLKNFQVTTKTI